MATEHNEQATGSEQDQNPKTFESAEPELALLLPTRQMDGIRRLAASLEVAVVVEARDPIANYSGILLRFSDAGQHRHFQNLPQCLLKNNRELGMTENIR